MIHGGTANSLVAAGEIAGLGVTTLLDGRAATGVVTVVVAAVALGVLWRASSSKLRRRVVAATLTTVSALAAAGWGLALTDSVGTIPVGGQVVDGALVATAALGTGLSVVAGAGVGYYGARLHARGDDETADRQPRTPGAAADAPGRASETETGRVAEQKRAFYFLNNLLRHHVLNGLNVIEGYARRVEEADVNPDTDDSRGSDTADSARSGDHSAGAGSRSAANESAVDPSRAGRVIRERTETMTTVVQNVRAVADVFAGDPTLTTTDLTDVVGRAVERADDEYPAATVTASLPETATVWCPGGSDSVVWEVVENGIVHNDEPARVHLHVAVVDDSVWLHVLDDGPGLSPEAGDRLFEPGTTGDQGLGLYLVSTLMRYGRGDVWVADPAAPTALAGVTDDERGANDERVADLLDADGACLTLQFAAADGDESGDPPPTPALDDTVEHAIDRPENADATDRN